MSLHPPVAFSVEDEALRLHRCDWCRWPLKATIDEGCTADSCSMRPMPDLDDEGRLKQEIRRLRSAISDCSSAERANCLAHVPLTWLDPMLTGPDAVIGDPPYTCKDIEAVCKAIRRRIEAPK